MQQTQKGDEIKDTIITAIIPNLTEEEAKRFTDLIKATIEIELIEMKKPVEFRADSYRDEPSH